MSSSKEYIAKILAQVEARNANQPEFLQAVEEVLATLAPALDRNPKFEANSILERLVEPERQLAFRVAWEDDNGKIQINRGFRFEFNSQDSNQPWLPL